MKEKQRFIKTWIISGTKIDDFHIEQNDKNQIKFEQHMRKMGVTSIMDSLPSDIKLGGSALEGSPWRYHNNRTDWFVSLESTSATPKKIEALAFSQLYAEESLTCEVNMWSFPTLALWVNGELVGEIQKPAYKPMQKNNLSIKLKKGYNDIFVQMQNIGMRDSRNIFGIEIVSGCEKVKNELEAKYGIEKYIVAEKFLECTVLENNKIVMPSAPMYPTTLVTESGRIELADSSFALQQDVINFSIEVDVEGLVISKKFSIISPQSYKTMQFDSPEQHFGSAMDAIVASRAQRRGSGSYFAVFNVLARYARGKNTEEDIGLLINDLELIDEHIDCSDFLLTGLIRLINNYDMPEIFLTKLHEVALRYRYWMDEAGCDGMCFWSENHALMFHSAQMFLGERYAEETFVQSGRTGKEQAEIGRDRCLQWLESALEEGFEEFNSATYTAVTISALLNLVDYADETLSEKATAVLNKIFECLYLHIFDNAVITPQGRVYGDVIAPATQKLQDFIAMVDYRFPITYKDKPSFNMWLACFATTSYKMPTHLAGTNKEDISTSYISEYAEINLHRTSSNMLTSVSSPRENFVYDGYDISDPDKRSWTKDMNMRFHGRTCFEPGVYGYQQHLWYAALDKLCVTFVNHPGTPSYSAAMRPGYWYGNGIMPAIKQVGNQLLTVFSIDDTHPIHFTHTFWPESLFDKCTQDGHWLFGSKKDGYMALWCSGTQEKVHDVLQNCEYRCYGSNTAYYCVLSDKKQHANFADFIAHCKATEISFCESARSLTAGENKLVFEKRLDDTQYI